MEEISKTIERINAANADINPLPNEVKKAETNILKPTRAKHGM